MKYKKFMDKWFIRDVVTSPRLKRGWRVCGIFIPYDRN